jgi:hypothetical protein
MVVFPSPCTLRLLLHRIMKSQPLLKQLAKCFVSNEKPERLMDVDQAYDSDPSDVKLAAE